MMGMQPRGSRVRRSRRGGLLRRGASALAGHTRTKTNAGLVAVVAVFGLLILAGCGGTTSSVTSPASPAPASSPPASSACGIVGETGPGGGKIFYVDLSRAAGIQCFEAAPDGWNGGADPVADWGCGNGTKISGATGTGIGAGKDNTDSIGWVCNEAGIAARLAGDYTSPAPTSKSDWFLPSKDELNQLCKYARGQSTTAASQAVVCATSDELRPGFAAWYYWSSSQYDARHAWVQHFGSGGPVMVDKRNSDNVRPVRTF